MCRFKGQAKGPQVAGGHRAGCYSPRKLRLVVLVKSSAQRPGETGSQMQQSRVALRDTHTQLPYCLGTHPETTESNSAWTDAWTPDFLTALFLIANR